MLRRFLRAVVLAFLAGGAVGSIALLAVYVLDPATRPYLRWMFGTGAGITAVNLILAYAITRAPYPTTTPPTSVPATPPVGTAQHAEVPDPEAASALPAQRFPGHDAPTAVTVSASTPT